MFISLSRTYIQNFSNWNALFVVFFLSHSVAVVAWCGTQRVDPQMVHFELFYHLVRRSQEPGARSQFNPQTIFVHFRQLEKIHILGVHLRAIIIPVPFHSKAFVLLQKIDMS